MHTRQRIAMMTALLAPTLLFSSATAVHAASSRGFWSSRLWQLGGSLHGLHRAYGEFPLDRVDATGKPLLSWRVTWMPAFESPRFQERIQLKQPWNSPANKDVFNTENPYYNFHTDRDKSALVMPRGPGTFWGDGGRRTLSDFRGDPRRTILLIEVDKDAAPVWTEPRDLDFDPEYPRKNLGWNWRDGFFHERGCFAIFGDGSIGVIVETIDDDKLRSLFAGDDPGRLSLRCLEAMVHNSVSWILTPTLVLGLLAGWGSLAVIRRIRQGRSVAPGELLGLILGVQYLVFLPSFLVVYEYPFVTPGYRDQHHVLFRLLPRIAGCLVCCYRLPISSDDLERARCVRSAPESTS